MAQTRKRELGRFNAGSRKLNDVYKEDRSVIYGRTYVPPESLEEDKDKRKEMRREEHLGVSIDPDYKFSSLKPCIIQYGNRTVTTTNDQAHEICRMIRLINAKRIERGKRTFYVNLVSL